MSNRDSSDPPESAQTTRWARPKPPERHPEPESAPTSAPASTPGIPTDRVNPRALRHIHVPHIDREGQGARGEATPPALKLPHSTHDLSPFQTVGSFRALSPETTLRLLSQAHADYFAADFQQTSGEFIQLRYHLGGSHDPFELRSDPFPLDVDSWSPMREQLVAHIRSKLSGLPLEAMSQIPVRMVYFHDARVAAPSPPPAGALAHPLDFACWLQLTVGEFAQFEVEKILPTKVHVGFDAGYLHLGTDTSAAFRYVKHWRFFGELLLALSKTVERPLSPHDPPIEILVAHTRLDVADLVLGLGVRDRRTYESAARVYRPRVEAHFSAEQTLVSFNDPQGIMRLFAMDLPTGTFRRQIHSNRVVLSHDHTA